LWIMGFSPWNPRRPRVLRIKEELHNPAVNL
jgi:hypothetical protein